MKITKKIYFVLLFMVIVKINGQQDATIKNKSIAPYFTSTETDTISEYTFTTICLATGKLRAEASPLSECLKVLSKGDSLKLTDFELGYWIVIAGPYYGYINDLFVVENEAILQFKEQLRIKRKLQEAQEEIARKIAFDNKWQLAEAKKLQQQEAFKKEQEAYQIAINQRNNEIKQKYGDAIGTKIINRAYWIGMTKEMAKLSIGPPYTINRSKGEWGVHEQWIYYNKHLYFENGILVKITYTKNHPITKKY